MTRAEASQQIREHCNSTGVAVMKIHPLLNALGDDATKGEIVKALKAQDLNDFIRKEGGEPVGSTPEELASYFKREAVKYTKVINAAKVVAD